MSLDRNSVDLRQYCVHVLVPFFKKLQAGSADVTENLADYYIQKEEQSPSTTPTIITATLVPAAPSNGKAHPTDADEREEIWSPDYDTPVFHADLESWFKSLECQWIWQPISLKTSKQVIQKIVDDSKKRKCVVMNLCDGTEADGYPGTSVVKLLEENNIPYSGANTFFYDVTISKPVMKKYFRDNKVSTAPFVEISENALEDDVREAIDHVGFPFIVKPSQSCASQGIQEKSVCWDRAAALTQIPRLRAMKGIGDGGVFVEKFVIGREFTGLVVGHLTSDIYVYPVVERAFHSAVPLEDRYLTFEKYWDVPNPTETPLSEILPPGEKLYTYKKPEDELQQVLQDTAKRAFISLNGTGYARVDMRMSAGADGRPETDASGRPLVYVLEVNSQCGLSTDDETSVSWIMKLSGSKMFEFVGHILRTGIHKQEMAALNK